MLNEYSTYRNKDGTSWIFYIWTNKMVYTEEEGSLSIINYAISVAGIKVTHIKFTLKKNLQTEIDLHNHKPEINCNENRANRGKLIVNKL